MDSKVEKFQQPSNIRQRAGEYILTNIKSLSKRSNFLQQHAYKANESQNQAMEEITARATEIGDLLQNTSNHVSESIEGTSHILNELDNTILDVEKMLIAKISNVEEQLLGKTQSVNNVMEDIQEIAFHLNLLALNAAVEAAHAGKSGKGFAIVAQEVRELARRTAQRSEDVSSEMDLSSIQGDLGDLLNDTKTSLTLTKDKTTNSITDLHSRFTEMKNQISKIDSINNILFEVIDLGKSSLRHAMSKIEWTQNILQSIIKLPQQINIKETAQILDSALIQHHISNDNDTTTDRLSEIRKRGKIRIAVEPSFVGLSFRQEKNGSLQGLDIEYAKGLANWLGVEYEFIEYPWDLITELLVAGSRPGEPQADVVCSALPPSPDYLGIAYSETYTYLHWVLARRKNDKRINSLRNLNGKVLGIINDPEAFSVLEEQGVRWKGNENIPGGKVRLSQLIAYNDQSRIHDCLADGLVDAFAVDLPIYYWACNNPQSPWHNKIELLPDNIATQPFYYAMAVAASPDSYTLLVEINKFIKEFKQQPHREKIERIWQGELIHGTLSYRDESGSLFGEPELAKLYNERIRQTETIEKRFVA